MPELPEVETTIVSLRNRGIIGARVADVECGWARTVGGDPAVFTTAVAGRRFVSVQRRGKFIRMALDDGSELVAHLRMSGRLWLTDEGTPRSGYERVILRLDGGRDLRFHDPRKFGRFVHCTAPLASLAELGPEPLAAAFTARDLSQRLAGRRRAIKPLLLDQTIVAGLGNIYCDEALWEARIHPLRAAHTLSPEETAGLHRAIRRVLRRGIANLGTSLGTGLTNFRLPDSGDEDPHNQEDLRAYRRTGLPCRRCGTPIERIVVAQRSSHVCPLCQSPVGDGFSCPE